MKKQFFTIVALLAACGTLFADAAPAEKTDKAKPQKRHIRPPHRKFMRQHWFWVAFSELSAQERQAMLKLQREDPEKFRAEMGKRTEERMKAEMTRRKALNKLVEEYKKAKDGEKELILNKIKVMVRENFQRRLKRSRMQLEELRERADKLEKELDRREKAESKIVDAVVENIISGRAKHPGKPENFRGRNKMFPPPPPPPAPLQAE